MSIHPLCSLGAVIVVLAMVSGCAAASAPNQTVYLDPQTGEVVQHPVSDASVLQPNQRATTGPDTGDDDGYRRWQTSDGTHMLSVAPDKTPSERVTRCADGSLRMGSVGQGESRDNGGPGSLCDQAAD